MIYILKTNNNVKGGLELYSELLYNSLSKILSLELIEIKNKSRVLIYYEIFCKVLFSKSKRVIIHHGGFYEVCIVFLLLLMRKKVIIISHVNDTWYHIKNSFLLSVTKYLFEKKSVDLLLISSLQSLFFKKYKGILGSVIDSYYFEYARNSNTNDKYILFLGRVSVDKGIFDLINAYSIFSAYFENNNIPKLFIVGPIDNSTLLKELTILIDRLNLNKLVFLKEPIYSIESKINLIDSCIFGVYPSYYDTFPLVMLEFAARKKPLIISSVSESKYFIESNELLVNPGEVVSLSEKLLNLYQISIDNKYLDIHFEKSSKYSSNNISKLFLQLI
jgi:glycosyltransferase involved in cell wall biosynthesis